MIGRIGVQEWIPNDTAPAEAVAEAEIQETEEALTQSSRTSFGVRISLCLF